MNMIQMSHVIKDFVIDYNSDTQESLMEYKLFDEGLTYRYVYGEDKLGVTVYPISNGSPSVTTPENTIPLYYRMDHMGSSEFLTSEVTQKVTSWISYDEWGNITHNAVLKCGQKALDLVKNYTGHERDGVLGMYYAKARMYDTADKHGSTKGDKLGDKRFMAVDPVKGGTRNPQSMVQYTYVQNNPILYVDPLGMDLALFIDQKTNAMVSAYNFTDNRHSGEGYYWLRDVASAMDNGSSAMNLNYNKRNKSISIDAVRYQSKVNVHYQLYMNELNARTNVAKTSGNNTAYFKFTNCLLGEDRTYVELASFANILGYNVQIVREDSYSSTDFTDALNDMFNRTGQYLISSGNQVILGNYSGDITWLGTAGQIGTSLAGIDLPGDLRDFAYDLQHWEWTQEHFFKTGLDSIGLVPIIGVLKNGDEISLVVKQGEKVSEVVSPGAFKRYEAPQIEKMYGMKKGQYHGIVKKAIIKELGRDPIYKKEMKKVGENPDICLSPDGRIQLKSTVPGRNYSFTTDWYIQEFLP